MNWFFQNQLLFGEDILNSIHLFWGSWLDTAMYWITILGNESFYVVVPPILYWCFEKRRAMKIFIIFLISSTLNDLVKEIFQNPRPSPEHLLPGIRELNIAYRPDSPGFPSGHTQGAATFWGAAFWFFHHKTIRIISVLLILLIPYSRLYLGVHFFGDVVGGYLIGFSVLLAIIPLTHLYESNQEFFSERVLLAGVLIIPLAIFIAFPYGYIHSSLGSLSGITAGAIIAEGRIAFNPRGNVQSAIVKILIGLCGLFLLKTGLKAIFPSHLFFGYLRYFILGSWCSFFAPLIFSRFIFLKGNDATLTA